MSSSTNTAAGCDIEIGSIRKLTRAERKCWSNRNYKYVVTTPYKYVTKKYENEDERPTTSKGTSRTRTNTNHYQLVVPDDFLTDGASGCAPDYGAAWVFHDWLYATHRFDSGQDCSRETADKLMIEMLRAEKRPFFACLVKRLSERDLCCCFGDAWEKSGTRGPEFLTT